MQRVVIQTFFSSESIRNLMHYFCACVYNNPNINYDRHKRSVHHLFLERSILLCLSKALLWLTIYLVWLYLLKRLEYDTNAARLWCPWAAVHEYIMNSRLFIISPLISLMLLLMPSGPGWHCKPFNHWLMPMHRCKLTHTYRTTIPITDSASIIFSDCAYQEILTATRILCLVGYWIDRMCVQSLWIQNKQVFHSLAAWRGLRFSVVT